MQVPLRPGLQVGGLLGTQTTPETEPGSGTRCLSFTCQALAAYSSSATCQTADEARWVSPDGLLLPPPLYSLPSSSPPEKPITFLCVGAPWLFCSLNLGPCRRRGAIRNQHCQHFAPSLVQGRAVTLPTTLPHALLSFFPTQAARWTGYCCRRSQGTHPHLSD